MAKKKRLREKIGVQNIYDLVDKEVKSKCKAKNHMKQQIREYNDIKINWW